MATNCRHCVASTRGEARLALAITARKLNTGAGWPQFWRSTAHLAQALR